MGMIQRVSVRHLKMQGYESPQTDECKDMFLSESSVCIDMLFLFCLNLRTSVKLWKRICKTDIEV